MVRFDMIAVTFKRPIALVLTYYSFLSDQMCGLNRPSQMFVLISRGQWPPMASHLYSGSFDSGQVEWQMNLKPGPA